MASLMALRNSSSGSARPGGNASNIARIITAGSVVGANAWLSKSAKDKYSPSLGRTNCLKVTLLHQFYGFQDQMPPDLGREDTMYKY